MLPHLCKHPHITWASKRPVIWLAQVDMTFLQDCMSITIPQTFSLEQKQEVCRQSICTHQ